MGIFRLTAARNERRPEAGQVLVIFALSITVLFAAAGLAFDIGRFYSERRFLQNAADAAALAAANALIRGETVAQADAEARDILSRNFLSSPSGVTPALPPTTAVYDPNHPGNPDWLINGILLPGRDTNTGNAIRVAVQNTLGYTFGRVVGLDQNTIGGQARVSSNGDALPIVVRHYVNPTSPTTGAVYPCDGDMNDFQDLVSTADTACLGSLTSTSLRTMPTAGMNFDPLNPNNDPAHHGPIISLVGSGAKSTNTSAFRGFVALDIRNFYDTNSNVFYNGVTAGANANTIADVEAGWVAKGYPGPAFPPVVAPPHPDDQVGILDGNKSGIINAAIDSRFVAGDEVLAAVYSGTVQTIPDFTLTGLTKAAIDTTDNSRNGVYSMLAQKVNSFPGAITSSAFTDWGDSGNPYGTAMMPPITFSPTSATPDTNVTWATFSTNAAPGGIYTIWIKGHSVATTINHYVPVAINVGGVARDFTVGGAPLPAIATTGATGTGSFTITTPGGSGSFGTGGTPSTIYLTVEGGPQDTGALPVGLDNTDWTLSPSSITSTGGSGAVQTTVNLSINGGSLGPDEYTLAIRATGVNANGKPVTHVFPFIFDIATGSTSSQYVDIMGFAIYRITDIDSNDVFGYAISGVYSDMNDPALRRGQVARLVPWN
jgi:Flp pilus assembly protein TadG